MFILNNGQFISTRSYHYDSKNSLLMTCSCSLLLINVQLHSAVIIRYLGMMEKIVYAFKFNTHMFQSKHLPLWNLEKLLIKLVWEFFNRCNLFAIVCHPLPTLLKQEEILTEYMPKQFKQLCQLFQQTLKLENMLAWITTLI